MADYKLIIKKDSGRKIYKRDGAQVAKADVPVPIRAILRKHHTASDDLVPPYPPSKSYYAKNKQKKIIKAAERAPYSHTTEKECIFCGTPCKLTRLYDSKMVYLCDEHFYSKNLGQIAQQLRNKEAINA